MYMIMAMCVCGRYSVSVSLTLFTHLWLLAIQQQALDPVSKSVQTTVIVRVVQAHGI